MSSGRVMRGLDFLPTGTGLLEGWSTFRSAGVGPRWMNRLTPGATSSREVFRRGNLRLLRYETPQGFSVDENLSPVVLLPSMINRHYVLDLLPGKSLVEALLVAGFPVFMIEWTAPQVEDRFLTPDDLFALRISKALDRVAESSPHRNFHLLGQCLGGTFAIIETLLRPSRVKTLALLTTPVNFKHAGQLGLWANAPSFDLKALSEAHGNIPWALLQGAFQFLRPSLALSSCAKMIEKWNDEEFMLSFLALQMWANDNIAFPGECYRFLIEEFYQKNSLAEGKLVVENQILNLRELKLPVLEVSAMDDHIVPPSTRWPEDWGARNISRMDLRGGHIGAVLGGRAQKTFWPELLKWLKNQNTPKH